jgi:cytidylate kinase
MIKIVTVEREYGSGGAAIARKLALRLGWQLWDDRLTEEVARALPCNKADVERRQERRDPLYYRLLKSFMRGAFEGNPHAPEMSLVDADCIVAVCRRLITRLGHSGRCVIVGRGSQHFLSARSDAYRVFVYAAREDKIRRLRALGKSEAEASQLAVTVDAERAAFIKSYFHLDWPTRELYHLMVNSSVGEDAAVETILAGIAALQKTLSPAGRHPR